MNPHDFAQKWDNYLTRTGLPMEFPLHRLPSFDTRISTVSSEFLTLVGLPSAGEFQFTSLETGLRPLGSFLILGIRAGGDPVCLDTAHQDRVVLLDHENSFAVAEFVNSSVVHLAECILAFQEMIEEFQKEDEDAELYEGNVPLLLVEQTMSRFRQIDPNSVGENAYWPKVLKDI